ncbi:MAG: transposase [Dehalococcoidales bacterium]|nr:transposase [Dehalococcoidales bacterium]
MNRYLVLIVRAGFKPALTATMVSPSNTPLSEIIRALKSFSSRRINSMGHLQGSPVWQRNYYERVIRTEKELNAVRQYISANPANWELGKPDDVDSRPAMLRELEDLEYELERLKRQKPA